MAIYDKNGQSLYVVYGKDGSALTHAYDKSGNLLYVAEPTTLKVMTYNVGGWYIGSGRNVPAAYKNSYYALQTGMIENNDPDILFINEYLEEFSDDGTSALTMLQSLFPYVYAIPSGTYFGRVFCSKYPLTGYEHHYYTNETSRYYDSIVVTVEGLQITLVVTHLSTNSRRIAQTTELISYLNTLDYFICAGDLNTNEARDTTGQDYIDVIVPLLNAGFNLANNSTFGFFDTYFDETSSNPNVEGGWAGCLDNIITSSNIPITSVTVDTTKRTDSLSQKTDHMPLIATINVYA